MRGVVYWVGAGTDRWQDLRNVSIESGGKPGAPRLTEQSTIMVDENSGTDVVNLIGFRGRVSISRFRGLLVMPDGGRIDMRRPTRRRRLVTKLRRSVPTPRMPAVVRTAIELSQRDWIEAVRVGWVTLHLRSDGYVLVPVIQGGASITGSAAGGDVSLTTAWTGGVVPGSADDVILAATTGALTVNTTQPTWKTLDAHAYTNTITIAAARVLTIGGTSAIFGSGMTITQGNGQTSQIVYTNTGTTSVTTNGCAMPMQVNCTTGTVQMQDALTTKGSGILLITGTLDTNGKAVAFGTITWTAASNGAKLKLGVSALTTTTNGAYALAASAGAVNPQLDSGTSSITFSGSSGFGIGLGGLAFYDVTFVNGGFITPTGSIASAVSFHNLTINATVVSSAGVTLGANISGTGTLTLAGNSNVNRTALFSVTNGTAMSVSGFATVSITNCDFRDITAVGTAWSGTSVGDCQGNTNITFDAARTLYLVGGAQARNYSGAIYATSTGGATTAAQPLPQDSVIVDNNSSSGSYTLTFNMPRACKSFDTSAMTVTTRRITLGGTTNFTVSFYGDFTLAASNSSVTTTVGSLVVSLEGRGSNQKFDCGVATVPVWGFIVNTPGGKYSFPNGLGTAAANVNVFTVSAGECNFGSFDVHTGAGSVNNSGLACKLTGTGSWTVHAINNAISWTGLGLDISGWTGFMALADLSATVKNVSFADAYAYISDLRWAGNATTTSTMSLNSAFGGRVGSLTVTGSGKTVTFHGANVYRIDTNNCGVLGTTVAFRSITPGTRYGLVIGTNNGFVDVQDADSQEPWHSNANLTGQGASATFKPTTVIPAGTRLVLQVITDINSKLISSVTDTEGNTWSVDFAYQAAGGTGNNRTANFITTTLTTQLTPADTITMNGSGVSTTGKYTYVLSEVINGGTIDKTSGNSSTVTATALTTGATASLSQQPQIAFGAFRVNGAPTWTLGAGWRGSTLDNASDMFAYQVITGVGSVTGTATVSAAGAYAAAVATYRLSKPYAVLAPGSVNSGNNTGWLFSTLSESATTTLSTTLSRHVGALRAVSRSLSLSATMSRKPSILRTVSATLHTTSTMSRSVSLSRSVQRSLTLTPSLGRLASLFRSFSKALTLPATMTRAVSVLRSFSSDVELAPTMVRHHNVQRTLEADVHMAATVRKSGSVSFVLSTALNLTVTALRNVYVMVKGMLLATQLDDAEQLGGTTEGRLLGGGDAPKLLSAQEDD